MDTVEFAKGHGTGNDFVVVPDPDGALDLTPRLVAALCDRRYGIGGDGLLRVVRADAAGEAAGRQDGAEWFMDYRNADGSLAEMCGNGVRVFARYLVARGLAPADGLVLATRAGPVSVRVAEEQVSVTMAVPRLSGSSTARVGDVALPGVVVDCGNPHLVCPLPAGLELPALDLTRPPRVDHGVFPDGVNVELVTPPDGAGRVRMRVHERGVGETRSCGSGALAVAAVVLERAGRDEGAVTVATRGGPLTVALTAREAVLTGAAVLVAHGTVELAAFDHA